MAANNANQPRGNKLAQSIGVSEEHAGDMENVMKYMEEHRIPELFNEILTLILEERPEDAKAHIVECLNFFQKQKSKDPLSQKVYQFKE